MSTAAAFDARPSSIAQPIIAGVVASITGFSSSFALVLTALAAVGASATQASSGLLAVCVVGGLASIGVASALRRPVSFNWSTPGAAALIAAGVPDGGFPAAVGAFMIAGLLTLISGLWLPFERAITRIPAPIAGGMLAGILLPICLSPALAVTQFPAVVGPMVLVWLVMLRLSPRWSVPAALVVAIIGIVSIAGPQAFTGLNLNPQWVVVAPEFTVAAAVGISVPLFIVTMAGQNIPGFAVLQLYGYPPSIRPVLQVSGIGTVIAAFGGGHMLNLAAITAAIQAGPEAGPDRGRRWIATVSSGIGYLVFGAATGVIAAVVLAAPPIIITAVAGLALFGALSAALASALEATHLRLAAVVTLAVTVSGVSVAGIGAALWGLIAGLTVALVMRRRERLLPAEPTPRTAEDER